MNKLAKRAWFALALAGMLLLGMGVIVVRYFIDSPDWVTFQNSPHVYTDGVMNSGKIVDRGGTVVLDATNGKSYADSASLRRSMLHLLGDREGNITPFLLQEYGSELVGFDRINAIVYLQGGGRRVLFCGVTVVLLAGSTIVLNALVSRFSAKINLRIGNELRAEVFGMFLNTDWESLQQFHSGDLLSRINTDVSNVAGSVLGWIPSLILRLTQFLASLAVILVYDPTMAVLALLSAPVTLLLSRPLVGKMRSFNRDMRAVGSEMTAFQEETLQNIPAIKAFHLVDTFRERLDRVQERYYDTGIAFQRFSILTSSFLSSCGMLVSYLCLGWGAYRLWQGRIDFGTMVLFLQLASYLSSSLSALIHLVPSAIEASVSARRIMSVLELTREQLDHPERAQRLVREGVPLALSLQGLEFSYQGRAPVLKQLDLQVQPHEMIAIVGPSGSGKTTLFRLLLGLLHPTSGSAVLTGGGEALDVSPSTRCCFAYVPQDNVIFSGTVAETLRLVRPDAPEEALWAALRAACAEDFVRGLPGGLDCPLRERGGSLSEGQNQRLAIARAILADAPILLLDEVTSALDLETEQRVLENIAALPGKTCILSTHRPSVLSLCSRVYCLHNAALELLPESEWRRLYRNN